MGNILNRLYKVGNLICKYSHLRPVLYSRFNLIKWNTFKTKIRVSLLLSMFSLMFEGFNSQKANVVAAIPFTSTGNQESNLTLTNLLEIAGLALSLCCQSQLRVWTIDCTTRGSDTLQLNVHIKRKNNVKSMDMNSKGKGICLKYVTIGRPALFFWYLYLSVCCFHCDVSPFFLFLFRSLSPISDVLNSCYFILNFPAQQIFYHFHILIIVWQSPCTCSLLCTTYQIIDQRYQDNLSALRVLYSTVQYSMVHQ